MTRFGNSVPIMTVRNTFREIIALEFQAADLVDCTGSFNSRATKAGKTFSPALNLEIPPTVGGCGPTRGRTGLKHKGSPGKSR